MDAQQAIALYEISRMVSASLDLEATLQAATQAAHRLTQAHATALAVLDWEGNLIIRAALGPVEASLGESLPLDRGITAQALRERRPTLIPDMLEAEGRARPDLDEQYGVRCFAAVPLIWQAERLGVLTLAFTRPAALDDADLGVVAALGEQAAAAVAHARDYAEEQRLRAESEQITIQLAEQAEQLERAQRQVIENEKLTAIGQLIQGVAHEMNTPLGVVISNLSVLQRYGESLASVARAAQEVVPQLKADPLAAALVAPLESALDAADLGYVLEDLPALLEESGTGARRVADLVRSMGTFARRDSGGPRRVDLEEVLEAALTLAWNTLKQCAHVERHYMTVSPVVGVAADLTQLFVHLLINAALAVKETGTSGTVSLSVSECDGFVRIEISDTGVGMPPEHVQRAFEPFFTTRPAGEGTGMGLAVCYGVVQRHGGSIALDSRLGSGTTVTVALPVEEATQAAA